MVLSFPAAIAGTDAGATNDVGVIERGPHHRIVLRGTPATDPSAAPDAVGSRVVELATGMHYLENGRWLESVALVEPAGRGAVARRGAHKVAFSPNFRGQGVIDVRTPDGQHLRSHLVGLAYHDPTTGASVLLAEPKDSPGRVVPPNQVVYVDAFDGALADVRYTYTIGGLEQDVIVREALPPPDVYGLDPDRTRLEVWTEFVGAPRARVRVASAERASDSRSGGGTPGDGLDDEEVSFGAMALGRGRAFSVAPGEGGATSGPTVPIGKSWQRLEGRDFLIEAVDYASVKPRLEQLRPASASLPRSARRGASRDAVLAGAVSLPAEAVGSMELAAVSYAPAGLVLDYVQVNTTSDFTFEPDTTYRIAGEVNLTGTTTIRGGAVVKFAPGTTLTVSGYLHCDTAESRAWFVAETDGTVGEPVATGAPVGSYAACALQLYFTRTGSVVSGIEFRNALDAIQAFAPAASFTVRDCRFVECTTAVAVYYCTVGVENASVCQVDTVAANRAPGTLTVTGTRESCEAHPGDDHGDSIASATRLPAGVAVPGRLQAPDDLDFFRLTLSEQANVTVYATGTTDTYGQLYDGAGRLLAVDNSSGPRANFGFAAELEAGVYYVAVSLFPDADGSYDYAVRASVVSSPPDPGISSLVTDVTVASGAILRNDHTGWVGFRFQVGKSALRVTQLGRWISPGNQRPHWIKLTDVNGQDVPGANVMVATAGMLAGTFSYGELEAPVTLPARGVYNLVSEETAGGDRWVNHPDCVLTLGPGVLPVGPTWAYLAQAWYFSVPTIPLESYGPVSLRHGDPPKLDGDDDGLLDAWELEHFGDLTATPEADPDQDGLSNLAEFELGTLPRDADSDDDGLNDGAEVAAGTDPRDADSDDDGLTDGAEIQGGTQPLRADTDEDGLGDGAEVTGGTDPLRPDTDDDGLLDGFEHATSHTDPRLRDSDGDGIEDGEEAGTGGLPWRVVCLKDRAVVVYASRPTATEGGTAGEFTVLLPRPAPAGGTVVGCYLKGNAVRDREYILNPPPGSLLIPAGAQAGRITVTAVNDTEFADMLREVELWLTDAAGYDVDACPAVVELVDNDLPAVRVLALPPLVGEPRTAADVEAVKFLFIRDGDLARSLVQSFTLGGTAQAGVDYQALPLSVTFLIGERTVELPVVLRPDLLDEAAETITLTLKPAAGYQVDLRNGLAMLTIRESGMPPLITVQVAATDADAREGGNGGMFTISCSPAVTAPLQVHYRITGGGSAIAVNGGRDYNDYEGPVGSVIIAAGKSSALVPIIPVSNTIPEELERVTLTLAGGPGYLIGTANSATVAIDDDDATSYVCTTIRGAIYGPSVGRYVPGRVLVIRKGSALASRAVPCTITPVASDGRTLPLSYVQVANASGGNVVFPAGQSRVVVELKPVNAAVATVGFQVTGSSATVPCGGADRLISILPVDNDAEERVPSNTARFIVRRAAGGPAATVPLRLGGSALLDTDYALDPPFVRFGLGQADQTITLRALNDDLDEGWESVIVRLDTDGHRFVANHPQGPANAPRESYAVLWVKDYGTSVAKPEVDTDGDALTDSFEERYGLDPLVPDDVTRDVDRDGLGYIQEQALATDPTKADSNGNGRSDYLESFYGTPPGAGEEKLELRVVASSVRQYTRDRTCYTCHALKVTVGDQTVLSDPDVRVPTERQIRLSPGRTHTVKVSAEGIQDPARLAGKYTVRVLAADGTPYAFVGDPSGLLGEGKPLTAAALAKTASVAVPNLTIATDVDGDGVVSATSPGDRTTAESPFPFWLNDDWDVGNDDTAHDQEVTLPAEQDRATLFIEGLRDLEDFARLHVRMTGATAQSVALGNWYVVLRVEGTSPDVALRVFPAVESDGGTRYLTDLVTGRSQVTRPALGVLTPSTPLTIPNAYWVTVASDTLLLPLLFEGAGAGSTTLRAELRTSSGLTAVASPPLHMALKPVAALYEHWTVGDNTDTDWLAMPNVPSRAAQSAAFSTPRTPAEREYVLFVHGWRMQPWERRSFAATAFKRLWHVGYRGRFGLYSWPTDWCNIDSSNAMFGPSGIQNYDRSEHRAWYAGLGLCSLLTQLNRLHPGEVRLIAHSMGNVVASEALLRYRKASRFPSMAVDCYVASQAATVAHAYDAVGPEMIGGSSTLAIVTPEVYAHFPRKGALRPYFAGMSESVKRDAATGRARVYNYHNSVDFALSDPVAWRLNQLLKPDEGYDWRDRDGVWIRLKMPARPLWLTTDYREIFSHVAQARSKALGCAEDSSHHVRGEVGDAVDLSAVCDLHNRQHEHSGQFNATFARRWNYWDQVARTMRLSTGVTE